MNLRNLVLSSTLLAAVAACNPAPRHTLTVEERKADLAWLFSQFGQNYAPLTYKEERFNFKFDELKAKYLAEAETTKTNEEFYLLMHRFVAEFKDAHTGGMLMNSNLPDRAKVAYVGFTGERRGDIFVVTELLPTYKKDSNFPIKKDMKITKVDGEPISQAIESVVVPYRHLGQEEANLTEAMAAVFTRLSTKSPLPTKQDMTVTVVDSDNKETTYTIPWIVKDLAAYELDQKSTTKEDVVKAQNSDGSDPTEFVFLGFDGQPISLKSILKKYVRAEGNKSWDNFRLINHVATWKIINTEDSEDGSTSDAKKEKTKAEQFKEARKVPDGAIFLDIAKTYPTYITREQLKENDKPKGESKLVATMWIDTFSPAGEEKDVIKEVKETLLTLERLGVKDIIIDMINNGGGSLGLGIQLAQLFSTEKIKVPKMQFALSETWLDEFETQSLKGPSDSDRELYRRVFKQLLSEKESGKRLSSPISTEALYPFAISAHTDLKGKFNVHLLVNEMCASMCDIFSAVMKDNNMATVVGTRTMGAGGNVVMHFEAPNSHFIVNQTESLMLREDGSYIENNGVEAEVKVKVSETAEDKYEKVRDKAVERILGK